MEADIRMVSIEKNNHHYLFRYESGYEDEAVESLMQLAESDNSEISWLDAATLSFQITCSVAAQCEKTLSPLP